MALSYLFSQSSDSAQSAPPGSKTLNALAALGIGVASLAIITAPAKAFQTTVPFNTNPSSNQATRTFNGGFGVQATFSNASTTTLGASKTISNNANGICIGKSGFATSACGRSTLTPNTNGILRQGTIDLAFNQKLHLQGFRVGQNNMNNGSLIFSLNGNTTTYSLPTLTAGATLYTFPGGIDYTPGDTFTIQSTATNLLQTNTFYLSEIELSGGTKVPAPLPILATATAFGWSRRLRSRVRRAAAVAHS